MKGRSDARDGKMKSKQSGTMEDFLAEMQRFCPEDARIMACQFRGDPNSDIYGKWRARTLRHMHQIDNLANVYLCVSAMKKNSRDEFRRRKENFAGGLVLMIDDVGTGAGSKFPLSLLKPLPPTALVETSPGNFQATYFFDRLVTDLEEFDALIRAFIEKQFLSQDTGMAGVNRVFRPPVGINGKAKYRVANKPWQVAMTGWEPGNRYSPAEIAQAFGLATQRRNPIPRHEGTLGAMKGERLRGFVAVRSALRSAGMLKHEEPDYSGWIQCSCPWIDDHSDGADTGAAIRLPATENEWYGAFRCHHGHCEGKGWKELTEWISTQVEEVITHVNKNAPTTLKELLK